MKKMNKIVKIGFKLVIFACMGASAYAIIDGVNTINRIDSV